MRGANYTRESEGVISSTSEDRAGGEAGAKGDGVSSISQAEMRITYYIRESEGVIASTSDDRAGSKAAAGRSS